MKLQIGGNYFSPYLRGYVTLKHVNEEDGYVIFWHNPGWVGNWFWKTSIDNFENQFSPKVPEEFKSGIIPGVHAVQVDQNYKVVRYIRNRVFK